MIRTVLAPFFFNFSFLENNLPPEAMALTFCPTRCRTLGLRSRHFGFLGADPVCTSDRHAGHEVLLRSASLPPIPIEVVMRDIEVSYLNVFSCENPGDKVASLVDSLVLFV